jgi:hypothetical protein
MLMEARCVQSIDRRCKITIGNHQAPRAVFPAPRGPAGSAVGAAPTPTQVDGAIAAARRRVAARVAAPEDGVMGEERGEPARRTLRVVAVILGVGWAASVGVYLATSPAPRGEAEDEIDDMEHSRAAAAPEDGGAGRRR